MSTDPIVVGVDGQERARRAAETAARLAVSLGVDLHVVCAYSRDQTADVPDESGPVRVSIAEESADIAARAATELSVVTGVVTTSAAVHARPADALLAEAERLDAQMIVVGNRRMQGIARVLGSVPAAVAHHATCDVHIVNTT